MAERSLRNQGPLRPIEEAATPDDILGRPEDQARAHQGQLLAPDADFERGLQSAAANMEAGKFHRAADFAEEAGDMERAHSLRGHAVRIEEGAQHYAPRVGSTADVGGFGDAIDYAQGALGQAAPSIGATTVPAIAGTIVGGAIGSVVPGVGTAAGATIGAGLAGGVPGFRMEAGEAAASQYADEYIRNLPVGERIRQQNIKGGLGMAAELVLPRLVGGRLLKGVTETFQAIGKEGAKAAAKKTLRDRGKDISIETVTEAVTEGTQAFIGQQSLKTLNPNRDPTHDVQEIIDSVVMGALAGGGISLGTNVPGALVSGAGDAIKGKLPEMPKPKATPGARAADADLDAAAEGQGELDLGTPRQPEAEQDAQAAAGGPVAEETQAPLSDAELDRKARIRKSTFGTRIPVDTKAEPVLRHAEPEELAGLRELKPFTKGETKGQRRYIRSQPRDVDAFLKAQVERGVITQEVADSSTVEPLGQSLKRKKASEQEMENELAGIVRDLLERIESNRKSGNVDMVKGLTSELENLPIDIAKRGEVKREGAVLFEKKTEEELQREKLQKGPQKKKATPGQGELFPEDIGSHFPVQLSEFKKTHFGFEINPVGKAPKQGELDLKKEGETYQDLLVRALDQYSVVLASDAAKGESAASTLDTKKARSRLDTATQEEKAELIKQGKVLKLRKKNGQTELVDADSLAAVAYAQEGGREAIIGNRANVGKAQEQEAAVAAGLASQLLRNDIEGLVDPRTNKVVTGVEADKALRAWVSRTAAKDRAQGKTPRVAHGVANKERRALGKYQLKAMDIDLLESKNRGKIQRGFKHMRERLLDDQKLNELAGGKKDAKITPKQARKLRRDLGKKLSAEVKRQRDIIKQATELSKKIFEANLEAGVERGEMSPLAEALLDAAPKEVADLWYSKPKKATAKFRADRLQALVEEIREMEQTAQQEGEVAELQGELEGGRAETLEETGVRHAEEHTGADRAVAVGTPVRGAVRQKKVPLTAQQREARKRRRLERDLKKITEAGQAQKLLERALGYKEGELPLTNQEQHVLMGSVAKNYLRDAMLKAGVPVRGAAEVVRGDRVVVLVAKADMEQVINSKEFGMLLDSGATIFMPESSTAFAQEFLNSGYKPMVQPGTTVAWTPSVGFDGESSTRRYSRESAFLNTQSQLETESAMSGAWQDQIKKVTGKQRLALQKKTREWAQNQINKGIDINAVLQKLEKKAKAAGGVLAEVIDEVRRGLEKHQQRLREEANKAVQALGDAGEAAQIRAQVHAQLPPSALVARLIARGGMQPFNNSEEQALAWVEANYADLVEMYVRREMLTRNPILRTDPEFANSRAAQVEYFQQVFGKKVAKRIGIAEGGKIGELFDITFQGEVVDPTKLPGKENAGARAVIAFLKRIAPNTGSTLHATAYFREVGNQAMAVMKYLKSGEGTPVVQTFVEGTVDEVTGVQLPEIRIGKEGGRDEFITKLFGKEHVGKTAEELLDVPMLIGDSTPTLDRQMGQLRRGELSRSRGYAAWRNEMPKHVAFGKNMTLRQAIQGHKFLMDNVDAIDVEYTGDLERLAGDNGNITEGSGHLGSYTPLDDRVTLADGALQNRFLAGWVAWHELYHRGFAVQYGEQIDEVLKKAHKNPTVRKIAKAIKQERTMVADASGRRTIGAVEEAMVELGAAIEMNDFTHITQQYGVVVSENMQKPLEKLWAELKALMQRLAGNLMKASPEYREMSSDIDVLEILKDARNAALNSPTNRKGASQALVAKGFDPSTLRFSRDTSHANVQNAINGRTREARQRRITEYLAKVLGDRVNVLFEDIQTDQDAAGWFDWATSTIALALNTTNAEGTARHEAFHAFFHALGKMEGDHKLYNRLLKASRAPHIKKQLRDLLRDSPAALEQLSDAEERLAYMFQFYASGQLKLQAEPKTIFGKWAKNLAKIVGYVSRLEAAETIFQEFNDGHLKTDAQIRDAINRLEHKRLAKDIAGVVRPVRSAMEAVTLTATDRLRRTNNQSLKQIADLFAYKVKQGGMAGFIAMRAQKESQFNNLFNAALERHTKGLDSKAADELIQKSLAQLQGMAPDSELTPLAKDLRLVFRKIYPYLRDAQNDVRDADGNVVQPSPNAVQLIVGYEMNEEGTGPDYNKPIWKPIADQGPRYFPRVWSLNNVLDNWDQFVRDMQAEGNVSLEDLNNFKRKLEAGDGMLDIGNTDPTFDAQMRAVNNRIFDFINEDNAHKFEKYQEKDVTKILTTYARQAAHRGEQTRHFGYNNQKIDNLLKQAKEEGATNEELKMADKSIRALNGTLGTENMQPWKKNAMMTAMTVVNFAVLPLALFSSLVDPLGVAVRTGDFKAAGNTFIAGAKQIHADLKGDKTQHQKMAEFLGIIEQEQVLSVLGDQYNSMFANETLQKWNTRFFKAIGLDAWTKGTRIGAMVASMEYMKEYQNDAKRMGELGIEVGDIQLDDSGNVEVRPAVLGQEKARRVQAAIYRMTDEAILRPTAAQRPIFMSDMRFVLLGHLKQFTFSFHNTIMKQVAKNVADHAQDGNYGKAAMQLAPLVSYVPFMMAADVLRAIVGGRIDDEDDRDMTQYVMDSVQRAGVLGIGTFGIDAVDDISYGGAPINTFLGPTIHKGARLIEAGVDPDESFSRQAVRLMPGYAFWKGWLE